MNVIRATGILLVGEKKTYSVVDAEDKEEEARLLEREDWKPYNGINAF